jgi:hypothetical protein
MLRGPDIFLAAKGFSDWVLKIPIKIFIENQYVTKAAIKNRA